MYDETYQTDPAPAYVGQVADMSPSTIVSRTVLIGALGFGLACALGASDHSVRPLVASALTAVKAPDAGNTGDGVMTLASPATGTGAIAGGYRVVCIEPGANVGTFSIEDPNGVQIDVAVVAVAYDGVIKFTIADGAADFIAGDAFTVTVTETDMTGNDVYGIVVRSQATENLAGATYPVGDTAAIMLSGSIWVTAGETVAPGDSVYVTIADGKFKKTKAAGNVAVEGAVYESSGAADALVRIRKV